MKKNLCKWTCAVQTHIVHESNCILVLLDFKSKGFYFGRTQGVGPTRISDLVNTDDFLPA